MRALGIDVGDKTIGVAVSDPLGVIPVGVTTIERVGIRKDAGKVIDYIKEYDCDTLVIGYPVNLDGSHSIQTEKVLEFKTMIENKMRSSAMKVNVVLEDERFTTKLAAAPMMNEGIKKTDQKKVVDKQAAMIILQSYMDKLKK